MKQLVLTTPHKEVISFEQWADSRSYHIGFVGAVIHDTKYILSVIQNKHIAFVHRSGNTYWSFGQRMDEYFKRLIVKENAQIFFFKDAYEMADWIKKD